MAKMTIAQLREKEVFNLASYNAENDVDGARHLMNRFYRLAALDERVCYLENDERTCNRKSTKEASEKAHRWFTRLRDDIQTFTGGVLTVYYSGVFPSIGTKNERGAVSDKIARWFY